MFLQKYCLLYTVFYNESTVKALGECIGTKINIVKLNECSMPGQHPYISNLLENNRIERLNVMLNTITNETA